MKNKGMLLERLINNTINHYKEYSIAYFFKTNLKISIKKITGNNVIGKLYEKSSFDYYGVYKGEFIALEAKSTSIDKWRVSNLKMHQRESLTMINKCGGKAYIILGLSGINKFFMIDINKIIKLKEKTICEKIAKKIGKELFVSFPGILNFLN